MKIVSPAMFGPLLALALTWSSAASAADPAPGTAPKAAKDPAAKTEKTEKTESPPAAPAQEVTLKGTLGCGKCSFKKTAECQNVLKVKEEGKEVTYFLAPNDVSNANHEMVCSGTKQVTVKGTVAEESGKKKKGGKKILTASEIKVD
jgi:hypothetical protein